MRDPFTFSLAIAVVVAAVVGFWMGALGWTPARVLRALQLRWHLRRLLRRLARSPRPELPSVDVDELERLIDAELDDSAQARRARVEAELVELALARPRRLRRGAPRR